MAHLQDELRLNSADRVQNELKSLAMDNTAPLAQAYALLQIVRAKEGLGSLGDLSHYGGVAVKRMRKFTSGGHGSPKPPSVVQVGLHHGPVCVRVYLQGRIRQLTCPYRLQYLRVPLT